MEISFGSLNNITSKCHLKWHHKLSLVFFQKTALYELLLFFLDVAFKDACCGFTLIVFTNFWVFSRGNDLTSYGFWPGLQRKGRFPHTSPLSAVCDEFIRFISECNTCRPLGYLIAFPLTHYVFTN